MSNFSCLRSFSISRCDSVSTATAGTRHLLLPVRRSELVVRKPCVSPHPDLVQPKVSVAALHKHRIYHQAHTHTSPVGKVALFWLTFHYQGVTTANKLFPEISWGQRSAWDAVSYRSCRLLPLHTCYRCVSLWLTNIFALSKANSLFVRLVLKQADASHAQRSVHIRHMI